MSTNHNDDDDASAQLGRVVNQTFGSNKSQYNTNHRRETRRKRVLLPLYLTKQKLMTPKEENTYKLEKLDSFCFRGGGGKLWPRTRKRKRQKKLFSTILLPWGVRNVP